MMFGTLYRRIIYSNRAVIIDGKLVGAGIAGIFKSEVSKGRGGDRGKKKKSVDNNIIN